MKIGIAWEKRDWGAGRRTWRKVGPVYRKYGKHTRGPSQYAIRVESQRRSR